MTKSMIEIAYDYMSNSASEVTFRDLWNYVVSQSGLSEEEASKKIGQFYTNIMMDGRFVTLGENKWDLRVRHTFEKVHIDMKDVYSDVEEGDSDKEEAEDEKEYNEAIDGADKEEKEDADDDENGASEEDTKDNSSEF